MQIKWGNLAILAGCFVLVLFLTKYRVALRESCDTFMLLFWKDGDELYYSLIIMSIITLIVALAILFFGQRKR